MPDKKELTYKQNKITLFIRAENRGKAIEIHEGKHGYTSLGNFLNEKIKELRLG